MGKSESIVSQEIILEAAKHGILLMRNNSGAGKFIDEATGNESYVRFGLHNLSKEQNKRIKSSDLIGVWQLRLSNGQPTDIGVFIAIEVKREGWVFNPNNEREQAQKAFIDLIISKGGVAGFCNSVDDFLRLIGKI